MKNITKEEAVESCKEHLIELIRQWEPEHITDKAPDGCYMSEEHRAACWSIHCPFDFGPFGVGGSRIIVVSQKTGKIIFDATVGE